MNLVIFSILKIPATNPSNIACPPSAACSFWCLFYSLCFFSILVFDSSFFYDTFYIFSSTLCFNFSVILPSAVSIEYFFYLKNKFSFQTLYFKFAYSFIIVSYLFIMVFIPSFMSTYLKQGWPFFSVKDQKVNAVGSAGHQSPAPGSHLCAVVQRQTWEYPNWAWLCSVASSFTQTGGLDVACGPSFADP